MVLVPSAFSLTVAVPAVTLLWMSVLPATSTLAATVTEISLAPSAARVNSPQFSVVPHQLWDLVT